ncbi:MAG: hypothetical protein FAZ92_01907 [Accumulibacter sp.]|uniref:DNRLRE domain-containing protein n=1 Tax=Accumulibacter sp. TaxID=2053492 RepID=UPI0012121A5C|nr:DNRLRE domain-containing protein [Accumulibacter sp.]TLD45831.1 MAG: hypothetical protein FAZ92_01907 [Accumulibacter sp.]
MSYTDRAKAAPLAPLLLLAALAQPAQAATTLTLQPDEAASQDVFVYEFAIPGAFGIATAARVTNLDSQTLNSLSPLPAVPFGNFLGSSNTVPLIGAQGESRAHDTRSLLRFDPGALGIAAGQVVSASLRLFALPGLPPFDNPTPAQAITTALHRVTDSWSETGVTWETQPAVSGPVTSVTQDGVNQWVSFDVTALVRDWLADPAGNFGVELRQPDIVIAASGKPLASLYASSAWADAGLRPMLEISAIPEPPTAALLAGGLGLFGWVRRRRQMA